MQENQRSERRQLTRWQISLPTKVKFEGAVSFVDCTIRDLSFTGMQMCMKLRLPKDAFSKLTIVLSNEISLEVEVWAAWHRAVDGRNIYGLYFSKISDADKAKIYQFVCRNFSDKINGQMWAKDNEERGGVAMEDCRIFARIPAEFPVRYLNPRDNNEGLGQVRDISAKGMGILTDKALEAKTTLELWLEVPDKGQPIYTRGEVVWAKKLALDRYQAGISLEKADLMGLARVLRVIAPKLAT